jgi:hypothetical protein
VIDSESDAFPTGPEGAQWSAAALEREDVKIAAFEENWRPQAFESARNLTAKYGLEIPAGASRQLMK